MVKKTAVDVLIVIEHTARELEMACLIKYFLNKRGHSVKIESVLPDKERLIFQYSAKVILVPWWSKEKDNRYWESFRLNNPGAVFINLNQETYTSGKNTAILPVLGRKGVFQLSWGNTFTDALRKKNVEEDKIFQTGSVRLDFYHPKLVHNFTRTKMDLAKEFDLVDSKKWILYIASPRHLFNKKEQEKEAGTEAIIECRNKFLHDIDEYLAIEKDALIIYRPHPNLAWKEKERPEIKRLLKKYPSNFACIEQHSIRDWIVNTELCISVNSTSFVECIWGNTPYILYLPANVKREDNYEWFLRFPYKMKEKEELYKYLNGKGDYDFNICRKILKDYYDSNSEMDLSAERLCNSIEGLLNNTEKQIVFKRRMDYIALNACVLFIKKTVRYLARVKYIRRFFLKLNYKPLINVSIESEAALAIRENEKRIIAKIESIGL